MSGTPFRLTIPIERWADEEFVPAAASKAVALGSDLRLIDSTLDHLSVTGGPSTRLAPDAVQMTAILMWKQGGGRFATSLRLEATPLDAAGASLATIAVEVTSRWISASCEAVLADAAKTFALTFGCLEPANEAARALERALAIVSISAEVDLSEVIAQNRVNVVERSSQPPMSSDQASPLNPYALRGIPGVDAQEWAALGFAAVDAAPWFGIGLDPEDAVDWSAAGFTAEAARPWAAVQATLEEVERCDDLGLSPEDFDLAVAEDVPLDDYAVMAAAHVPSDEMREWLFAIEDHEMVEPVDVRYLAQHGMRPEDVQTAPAELSSADIVRYYQVLRSGIETPDGDRFDAEELDEDAGDGDDRAAPPHGARWDEPESAWD